MNEEILKEFEKNIISVQQSFDESYSSMLENIEQIGDTENNLETKMYLIQSTLKNLLKISNNSFSMMVAMSKLQKGMISKINEIENQ
jgi:hypothetical protein